MKRFAFSLFVALCPTVATADTVVLTADYTLTIFNWGSQYAPAPWSVHANEYLIPEVYPSDDPQLWSWPITELPATISWGMDGHTYGIAQPLETLSSNQRLLSFTPEVFELELVYWYHTRANGGHRLEWRIIGEGVLVPEPSALVLLLPLAMLGRRRR